MDKKYAAPAVSRLLNIIELMSSEDRGFSINEIARALGYPVNTVYRICMEMQERGYLEKDAENGLYYIGGRFFTIGQVAGSRIELRTRALPYLQRLRDALNETIHLTVLRGNRMVLLDQLETKEPIRIYVETGSLLYPHASAFGKCLLAYCGDAYLAGYLKENALRLTERTIIDPRKLADELEGIRGRGWAFDHEEYMSGVVCVGAPVHSLKGRGVAAVGVVAPSFRFTREKMAEAAALVKEAADEISSAMGYDCAPPAKL
ncbi:MAG: IclR family transcriptional regulator [Clostridia bacterium]|nr:IclR family transcriptional regulator [Clostridia bacterium]